MMAERYTISAGTVVRVNRIKAKRFLFAGKQIYCGMKNSIPWCDVTIAFQNLLDEISILYSELSDEDKKIRAFEYFENQFLYYNSNSETGRYIKWFVKEEDWKA